MGVLMFKIKKDQLFKVIKVIIPLLLLILAIYEIQQTARGVDVGMLQNEVSLIASMGTCTNTYSFLLRRHTHVFL